MTEQTAATETVTVNAQQVEAALRGWLKLLHVDLHYSLAEPEDGRPDQYPTEAADLFKRLRAAGTGR